MTNLIKSIINQTTRIYKEDMTLICELTEATVEEKENYIKFYNNDETKYLDKEGNELKNTDVFSNNSIFATKNEQGQWGFVDKLGNIVVDYQYEKVTEVNEYGYAGIKKDGKWGVVDSQGQVVLTPTYDLQEEINPIFMGRYRQVTYGFGEIYFEDLTT